MQKTLSEKAALVLENNWRKGFTIPCEGLYPFQWNWDSGFIALGWGHLDMERAKAELRSLLKGQWKNGFLPHIVFHNDSETYFPGPAVWDVGRSPNAPQTKTSGITQPPVLGFVLEFLYDLSGETLLDFVAEVFPALYRWHEYFYTSRDPQGEGLVYICHNWEAGTDNTPVWDAIWEGLDSPEYQLDRRDTQHVDAANRPSNREYQHYIHLVELFKSWDYDDSRIAAACPFLVQDPLFNSLLIRSNEGLIRLGKLLGKREEVTRLQHWQERALSNFHKKLYSPGKKAYVYYDLRAQRKLEEVSSSSFVPLFAGIPDAATAREIVDKNFENGTFSGAGGDFYLCASFDPTSPAFDPKRYWRGPVWINLNWLIFHGFRRYGFRDLADQIRSDTLELIEECGFYEYFDPRRALKPGVFRGYGGNNFSWSAALYLDLIKQQHS
ncbi:MAG: trehalase family glycosidase [Robiginitalea sp.]|jgi:neutral trehalase